MQAAALEDARGRHAALCSRLAAAERRALAYRRLPTQARALRAQQLRQQEGKAAVLLVSQSSSEGLFAPAQVDSLGSNGVLVALGGGVLVEVPVGDELDALCNRLAQRQEQCAEDDRHSLAEVQAHIFFLSKQQDLLELLNRLDTT